jgi:hypothetical protein
MFHFGSIHGMQRSFEYLQGAWANSSVNYQVINFFTGVPPTDFSQIAQDWQTNPNNIFLNSVASIQAVKSDRDVQGASGSIRAYYTHQRTHVHPKGNYFDPIVGRWILGDYYSTLWRTSGGIENYGVRGDTVGDFSSNDFRGRQIQPQYFEVFEELVLRDIYGQLPTHYHRTRNNSNAASEFSQDSNLGTVPSRYPIVQEFRIAQTVDSIFLRMSSPNFSSAEVTIDIWDDNEGDWGDQFVLTLRDDYDMQIVDFPQAYLTSKIRYTFGNTGSSSFWLNFLVPCSQTEPLSGKDSMDITWALITYSGGNESNSAFWNYPRFYFNRMDGLVTHNQNQGYPLMLVDVGEQGDDATVILNKARGVLPGEDISLLHMGLNWRDI